jgi:peptidoglycan/xylan/chitin deacetylase (PgdA/CDA1 family)
MATCCFTFDNMAEAADIGAGRLDGARPSGMDASLAVGYPAILDLLDRHGVRATFFVEGWNGVHHPAAVAELVERGHELGMHGWQHEDWSKLEPTHERELTARATDALANAAGVRPRGFRAPGGSLSPHSGEILVELGYEYDASLGADGMMPSLLPSGLVQIPFIWSMVDGFHYLADPPAPPEQVVEKWLRALDRAARGDGLFVTICHAFLTGIDTSRLAALERVITAAMADARIELHTAAEVAVQLKEKAKDE